MKRRKSGRRVIGPLAVRAVIRFADWVRSRAFVVLLLGVALACAAAWFTATTSAHLRILKSWERLFGMPAVTKARHSIAKAHPEAGISGYTVTSFDAPGAGAGLATGTIGVSIDAAGDVAGSFLDNNLVSHGFLRSANGTFTEFDAPGAGSSASQGTFAIAIDPTGNYIAGMFADSANSYHGFLRAENGTITPFDAGIFDVHQGTIATSVNGSGTVTGVYSAGDYQGFVRNVGGTVTLFSAPDAGTNGQPQGTIPVSINVSGAITGLYVDGNGVAQGFVRAASGTITEFGFPCQGATCYATAPFSIDDSGDIAGAYGPAGQFNTATATGTTTELGHGFLRSANGAFTSFDPPGSAIGSHAVGGLVGGTLPLSIDPTGNYVAGFYSDATDVEHGFVRTASGITTFDAPGAATSGLLPLSGTGAGGVNASGAIVGAYLDSNSAFHGLLLTPSGGQQPGFTLTNSGGVTVKAGNSGTSTLTVTPSGGFIGGVNFTCTIQNSPAGATCQAAPANVTTANPAPSTLTLSTSRSTPAGSYLVTITGKDAATNTISASTTLTLTVQAQPSFTLANSGGVNVVPGASGTSALTVTPSGGFLGAVSFNCVPMGSPAGVTCQAPPANVTSATPVTSVLTVSTTNATPPGSYTVTVTGSDSTNTITAQTTLTLAVSTFTLSPQSASVSVTAGATSPGDTITITPLNGFAGSVNFSASGLPSGVSAGFSPNPATSTSVLTLMATSAAPATSAPVTITGTSGPLIVTTSVSVTVNPALGFTLSASPTDISVAQGGSGTSTITVNPIGGFSAAVALSATGLPTGVTASFAPGTAAGTQVLTLTVASTAAITSTPVTITGTSGALPPVSIQVNLSIVAPAGVVDPNPPGPITITAGATSGNTATITVQGTNGLNGTVTLNCAVTTNMSPVNDAPTCGMNPTSLTISGTTTKTSTLTVTTTGKSSAANSPRNLLWPSTGGTALALAFFFSIPRRRRRWLAALPLFIVLGFIGFVGCGGGSGNTGGGGTTTGNYSIKVTGTVGAGAPQPLDTIGLTVN